MKLQRVAKKERLMFDVSVLVKKKNNIRNNEHLSAEVIVTIVTTNRLKECQQPGIVCTLMNLTRQRIHLLE